MGISISKDLHLVGIYDFLSNVFFLGGRSFANGFLSLFLSGGWKSEKLYWRSSDEFEISRTYRTQDNTKYVRMEMDVSNLVAR